MKAVPPKRSFAGIIATTMAAASGFRFVGADAPAQSEPAKPHAHQREISRRMRHAAATADRRV